MTVAVDPPPHPELKENAAENEASVPGAERRPAGAILCSERRSVRRNPGAFSVSCPLVDKSRRRLADHQSAFTPAHVCARDFTTRPGLQNDLFELFQEAGEAGFGANRPLTEEEADQEPVQLALVGRPNVGERVEMPVDGKGKPSTWLSTLLPPAKTCLFFRGVLRWTSLVMLAQPTSTSHSQPTHPVVHTVCSRAGLSSSGSFLAFFSSAAHLPFLTSCFVVRAPVVAAFTAVDRQVLAAQRGATGGQGAHGADARPNPGRRRGGVDLGGQAGPAGGHRRYARTSNGSPSWWISRAVLSV